MKCKEPELFLAFNGWYWDGEAVCLILKDTLHESLAEFIKRPEPHARSNVRAITIQLLKGPAILHSREIHYCDLNP
jgi:serine/threonine protein kinase